MKFKNLIYLSLFTGLCISSLFEFSSILSFQYKTENKDLNIKTNILNDYWIVGLENYGLDMAIDLNNCIYVMTPDIYYTELIIIKYTNYGDQLWRFNLEGLRRTSSEITVDSQSNLYLASNYYNQTTDNSMILFKFNSSGNLKWQQTWNEGSAGDIIDIAIDSDDNIYVFGTIYLAKMFKYDLFIIKYNSSGDQQWFYVYEELGREL